MANIIEKVQVLIGGNADQAKKVIKEVEDTLKQSQDRMKANSVRVGKDSGEQVGRAYAQAQDKWLKVAEDGLRRYGGRVGAMAANIIAQFDKISKARESSTNARDIERRSIQQVERNVVGTTTQIAAETGATYAATRKAVKPLENRFATTSTINVKGVGNVPIIEAEGLSGTDMDAFNRTLRGRYNQLRPRGFFRMPTMEDLGKTYGTTIPRAIGAGVVGVGLGVATIGAAVAGISALATKAKENAETRKQIELNNEYIESINEIKDPIQRTKKILEEFGNDGIAKFNQLKDSTKELQKSLGSEEWQSAADKAKSAMDSITNFFAPAWDSIVLYSGKAINSIMQYISGVSEEMVKEERQIIATTEKLKRKTDEILEKRAKAEKKIEEDRKKRNEDLLRDIQREKDESSQLMRDKIDLIQQEKELQQIVNDLASKKKRTLEEEYNLHKATNELTKVSLKVSEQKAKAAEDAADALMKQLEAEKQLNEKIVDRNKLSLSELADANTPAGRAAAQVNLLETQAKQATAAGRFDVADRITRSANRIRNELGSAGFLKSSEYGEEFPSNNLVTPAPTYRDIQAAQLKRMDDALLNQSKRMGDALLNQSAVSQYGSRLGPIGLQMQQMARERNNQMNENANKKGIDTFFVENGYLPMKARNAK